MTETTTQPTTETPFDPFGILTALITVLLAPMFLGVCCGDIGLARRAAVETVNAYRARNHADLIAVAQIIGFGLAALGSLSLSMADDVSVSMPLRLRGNANACNRAAEQNRRALAKSQASAPLPAQHQPADQSEIPSEDTPSPRPDVFLPAAAEHLLAAESRARLEQTLPVPPPAQPTTRTPTEKRHQQMWAIAMAKEASEITANLPNLPPAERQEAAIRAGLLSSTAHDLVYGTPVPRRDSGALDHINAGAKQPPLSATPA
jgi:hypothetical protein